MQGKRTSPELRQRILDMANAGRRYKEIKQETGVSIQTVHRISKNVQRKLETKKSSIPEELWKEWDAVTARMRKRQEPAWKDAVMRTFLGGH